VGCTTFRDIGWHTCSAGVSRTWAPQGKYNDDTFKPISRTFAVDQDWNAKRAQIAIQKLNDLSEQSMRAIKQMGDEAARRSAAQYNTFNQAQEMRQRQHEDFMVSMQRGTDMSMQRTAQSMNARSRAADDWCDYSLDLQKRLDPTPDSSLKIPAPITTHGSTSKATASRPTTSMPIQTATAPAPATGRCKKTSTRGHFSHPIIVWRLFYRT
jgi:hypothetical protein